MAPPALGSRARDAVPLAALAYPLAFGLCASVVASRPAPVRAAWLADLSTNLDNLADHPLRCLAGSAFVTDDGNVAAWTALALVGLAAAGGALGNRRLVALLTGTHLVGTTVSQAVLALQIRLGAAPATARSALDVGPSYVVAPALALGLLAGSPRARVVSGLGFAVLAPHLFGGLTRLEVAAVGHVVAIGVGLLAGSALVRDRHQRRLDLPDPSGPPLPRWSSTSR